MGRDGDSADAVHVLISCHPHESPGGHCPRPMLHVGKPRLIEVKRPAQGHIGC